MFNRVCDSEFDAISSLHSRDLELEEEFRAFEFREENRGVWL